MAAVLNTFNIFLHLLLLCMIHENLARDIPYETKQKIETSNFSKEKANDHQCLNHGCNTEINHIIPHMELSWNILFHIEDLKVGKNIPFYFSSRNSSYKSHTAHLIPKEEADSIPFSSSQISKILEFFSFEQDSPQGKAIFETLHHCEIPPLKGETKFCATSLESMLEKLSHQFGEGSNFRVLTTTQVKNWTPHLQNYTILEEPKEVSFNKMFGCHPLPYPYVVYYCHGQESDNRLFELSLEGEDGLRLEAIAICHMDTSSWDPNHISFRLLGIEPGTAPVCHEFPQDNLIWVSSPSSGN